MTPKGKDNCILDVLVPRLLEQLGEFPHLVGAHLGHKVLDASEVVRDLTELIAGAGAASYVSGEMTPYMTE